MQKSLLTCLLVFGFGFANFVAAQDEGSAAKTSQDNSKYAEQAEMQQIIMAKLLEKAEPTEEQKQKINEILKTNMATSVASRDQLTKFFTAEESKTFAAAMKMAKKAGYDLVKSEAYALKKLKFSEERKSKYMALKGQADDSTQKIFNAIASILSPEQLDKVPILKQMMPKKAMAKEGSGAKAAGSPAKGPAPKAGSAGK